MIALQRKCGCGGSCGPCGAKKKSPLRRSSLDGARSGSAAPPIVHDVEPRFGADFSRLRVHRDVDHPVALSRADGEESRPTQALRSSRSFGVFAPQDDVVAHELSERRLPAGVSPAALGGQPAPAPSLPCTPANDSPANVALELEFATGSSTLTAQHKLDIATYLGAWQARGANEPVRVDGYASLPGGDASNLALACDRAESVRRELESPTTPTTANIPSGMIYTHMHPETNQFDARPGPNQRATIATLAAAPPPAPPPPCPSLPTTNPGTCAGRNAAYCDAARCFPANPWLSCVCRASAEVCRAVDAFAFRGVEGGLLYGCINWPAPNIAANAASLHKASWFLTTNSCIWNHWRAAFDAIHDPSIPVPSGLTAEWNTAVTACRTHGLGSSDCCHAHVEAEQHAIDRCGAYNSGVHGTLPSDIPNAPICSGIVAAMAPPPPFTGDFGKVADRITYGIGRCC